MGLKLKSTGGTGSVELNCPDNHNINTSFTLPTSNFTGGEWVLADGSGNVNIDSGTLYVDAVNDRVGVGTGSPGVNLEVAGSEAEIRLRDTRVDDAGYWGLKSELSSGQRKLFIQDDGVDRITIDSSGNVGIGTAGPTRLLTVQSTGNANFCIKSSTTGTSQCMFGDTDSDVAGNIAYSHSNNSMAFEVNGSTAATIDSAGRLLVGTSSAIQTSTNSRIQAASSSGAYYIVARIDTSVTTNNSIGGMRFYGNDSDGNYDECARIECLADGSHNSDSKPSRLGFFTTQSGSASTTERMRIANDGTLTLKFDNGTYDPVTFSGTTTYGNGTLQIQPVTIPGSGTANYYTHFANKTVGSGTTAHNVVIQGSLSKGSGSFRVPHPLKPETHDLVHSFIEGPQADLIYRGHVQLVDGIATINIDEAGRMTEGTFEALCTNVCCFTSNESDWTAVRGSVSGNILTIEAQDLTSTAEICWMVVGERKDPHMIETDWTDEDGRVITEPLKNQAS